MRTSPCTLPALGIAGRGLASLVACGVAAGLAACGGGGEPPPQAPPRPPNAVIQVGSGYLTAEEIDRWVDTVALVEPTETRPSWRRKALTQIVLPRKVGSLLLGAERDSARAAVQAAFASLALGGTPPADGPGIERLEGTWKQVGLDYWGMALSLEPGSWSEVFETAAGFATVRLVQAPPREEWRPDTPLVLDHVTQYYLRLEEDPRSLIGDARRQMEVRAIDPEWEWILPKFLEYEKW